MALHHGSTAPMIPEMRVAFDARVQTHSSFERVLSLLQDSADAVGIQWEAWTDGPCSADVFWSTQQAATSPVQGPRFVSSIYDANPLLDISRNYFVQKWNGWKYRRSVRNSSKAAWKVVTCSQDSETRLVDLFPTLQKKIKTIPLFARESFSPGAPDPTALTAWDLNSGYLLYVGTLSPHKNWENLVRAWAKLSEPLQIAHQLVLVGRSRGIQKGIQKLCEELSPSGTLKVIDKIPDEGLLELYRGADLFCFPSLAEGFGLPPLEALACGIPVVSSDRTSLPEVLGPAALYADPLDVAALSGVLERGLMDGRTRQFLARTGPERAAAWNPERTGRAMKELLEI